MIGPESSSCVALDDDGGGLVKDDLTEDDAVESAGFDFEIHPHVTKKS